MKVAGFLPVHNAAQSLHYTLDYYLNHEHFDAVCIVDCGSFDGTAERVAALQDKRIITVCLNIDELQLLPGLAAQILQELFLKSRAEWVLPLRTGEFFHSSRHGRLKAALHRLRQTMALPPDTVLLADTLTFYESALDDAAAEYFFHKMRYCTPGAEQRPVFHALESGFAERAACLMPQGSCGGLTLAATPVAPEAVACCCYPMPGPEQAATQTLDEAALMIIRSNGSWLAGNDAAPGSLRERYQHIKNDTFRKYYQEQWLLSADQVAAGLARETVRCCDALLAYRPQTKF